MARGPKASSSSRSLPPRTPPARLSALLMLALPFALGALLGGFVVEPLRRPADPSAAPPLPPPAAELGPRGESQLGRPGPWGQLRSVSTWISPPDETLRAEDCVTELAPWVLPGWSRAQLDALLLPLGARAALLAVAACDDKGCTLRPTRQQTAALSAADRGALYSELARHPENKPQFFAYRWTPAALDGWMANVGLPQPLKERIRGLLYRRGDLWNFSDLEAVCPDLPQGERTAVVKAMASAPSVLAELVVPEGTDGDALVRYWGRGGREGEVRPLLESLLRHRGGASLDVSHLLPPFARLHLYGYPDRGEPEYNCHYSSLNFFARHPDERYLQEAEVARALQGDYQQQHGAPEQLGDIVAVVRPDGGLVHSMVYVADDLVFSKNGYAHRVPWLLTHLRDVRALYAANPNLRELTYRRRAASAAGLPAR